MRRYGKAAAHPLRTSDGPAKGVKWLMIGGSWTKVHRTIGPSHVLILWGDDNPPRDGKRLPGTVAKHPGKGLYSLAVAGKPVCREARFCPDAVEQAG